MRINFGDDHNPLRPMHYLTDFVEVTRRWNEQSGESISVTRVEQIHQVAMKKLADGLKGFDWE